MQYDGDEQVKDNCSCIFGAVLVKVQWLRLPLYSKKYRKNTDKNRIVKQWCTKRETLQ